MIIAVGSKNPVKIEAVRQGFQALWPDISCEVVGTEAISGVSDKPMSDEESIRGAKNRARAACEITDADYGIGLEGGIHQIGDDYFDCGWIVVRDRDGNEGIASTVKMITPPRLMKLIHEGIELGIASDMIFGTTNSKQGDGHFGIMTKNAITRTAGYRDGVIAALARFLHPNLF